MTPARYGLPKSHRILRSGEFAAILKRGWRGRNDFFGVYAVSNSHSYGRLGVVVSRKTSPRAVVRNRVKRQIRESFRQIKESLVGLDIVVVANIRAGNADVGLLRASLQQTWKKVEEQCKRS